MNLLRTLAFYIYLFGYMLTHYGVLRRAERARAAGDDATADEIVRHFIPIWCNTLFRIGGIRVLVEGRENIPADTPCVFVGNHRSCFDIPLMLTSLDAPHGLLSKEELRNIPLLSRWMNLLGCVYVEREDLRASVRALNQAAAAVKSGRSFIIFPEGTRYKGEEGGIGEFKFGAFQIAFKNGAPVVPVAISGSRGRYEEHHHLVTPGTVRVKILPPIQTAGTPKDQRKDLPEAVRQQILAHLD